MNSHTPSFADLEARLAELERQNRRLKRLGLLLLLIAGSGFLLAQVLRKPARAAPAPATLAATYDTLVVHRLELRDKAGKLRGLWGVDDRGSALYLYDAIGLPQAMLSAFTDGSGLWLSDLAGKSSAALNVLADGPLLQLGAPAGKPGAALSADAFSVTDAQGFKAVLGVTDLETITTGEKHTTSAAAVTLFGKDGKVIWRAP